MVKLLKIEVMFNQPNFQPSKTHKTILQSYEPRRAEKLKNDCLLAKLKIHDDYIFLKFYSTVKKIVKVLSDILHKIFKVK